jgi:D-alanine-D-alanine ligase
MTGRRRKTSVGLLFGGRSAEHEVSLKSAAAVYDRLDPGRFEVVSIFIAKDGRWGRVASPSAPPSRLKAARSFLPWSNKGLPAALKADIYFPVLHGPYGEDGTIQGLLEMADVPYVGAGVLASAAGMDKAVMKTLFAARGLPIVKHVTLAEGEWRAAPAKVLAHFRAGFELPLFVKPANLGSSVGISKVKAWEATGPALDAAFAYDRKVVVEQGVRAREIECSVLGNDAPRASLPGELIPAGDSEFYDYADKYEKGQTGFRIPAPLPPDRTEEARRLAVEAFRAVDGAGLARVDLFLDEASGRFFVNEINTLPGFTAISMYPRLWEATGLPFAALVEELIRLGFERHAAKKRRVDKRAP